MNEKLGSRWPAICIQSQMYFIWNWLIDASLSVLSEFLAAWSDVFRNIILSNGDISMACTAAIFRRWLHVLRMWEVHQGKVQVLPWFCPEDPRAALRSTPGFSCRVTRQDPSVSWHLERVWPVAHVPLAWSHCKYTREIIKSRQVLLEANHA